jgi:glycosyltransferase involved in cell wall biosynthesis
MAHDYNAICMRTSLTRDGEFCGGRCPECRPQRLIRGGLLRRSAPRLIAATDYVRDRHVEAGVVAAGDAITIPYGVLPGRTRVRQLRPGGVLRLAYIGTLGAHKGVDVLLEAFRDAPAEWMLDIAGAGDLSDAVRAAATSDPRITFHGFVEGPAKERFLDDADVLVVPSVWQEPAGIVALEATIRGLPFVVTDRGGLQEMPGAVVAPAGESHGLLEALADLASDDRLLECSRVLLEQVPAPTLERNVARVEQVLEAVSRRGQPDAGSVR